MKYDDASWHYGGEFPKELPPEAGATHIGMFVSWCVLNGLVGQLHLDEFPGYVESLKSRSLTPGAFLIQACDEKFTDEDLSDEGNAFARIYFDTQKGQYLADYEKTLAIPDKSLYHVADTWENFDKLAPVISRRFQNWKEHGAVESPKPWWRFWP